MTLRLFIVFNRHLLSVTYLETTSSCVQDVLNGSGKKHHFKHLPRSYIHLCLNYTTKFWTNLQKKKKHILLTYIDIQNRMVLGNKQKVCQLLQMFAVDSDGSRLQFFPQVLMVVTHLIRPWPFCFHLLVEALKRLLRKISQAPLFSFHFEELSEVSFQHVNLKFSNENVIWDKNIQITEKNNSEQLEQDLARP